MCTRVHVCDIYIAKSDNSLLALQVLLIKNVIYPSNKFFFLIEKEL